MIMAKRKQDPSVVDQLDMFGAMTVGDGPDANAGQRVHAAPDQPSPEPANDIILVPELTADIAEELIDSHATISVAVNDTLKDPKEAVALVKDLSAKLPVHQAGTLQIWLHDEWWTTAMVCAYLKLGRKAIWERQRDPRYQFPKPFHFGSMRQRWKSADVIEWARESQ